MPNAGSRGELGFPNSKLLVDGLDAVAKGLAEGTISRGRAIKLGGAALLGSMGLLSLSPGMAEAQGPCEGIPAVSNKRCPEQNCGACPTCRCARTVSGRKRCVELRGCPDQDQCDRNSDCLEGGLCIQVAGCCGHPRRNLCVPPCPRDPAQCVS